MVNLKSVEELDLMKTTEDKQKKMAQITVESHHCGLFIETRML